MVRVGQSVETATRIVVTNYNNGGHRYRHYCNGHSNHHPSHREATRIDLAKTIGGYYNIVKRSVTETTAIKPVVTQFYRGNFKTIHRHPTDDDGSSCCIDHRGSLPYHQHPSPHHHHHHSRILPFDGGGDVIRSILQRRRLLLTRKRDDYY